MRGEGGGVGSMQIKMVWVVTLMETKVKCVAVGGSRRILQRDCSSKFHSCNVIRTSCSNH